METSSSNTQRHHAAADLLLMLAHTRTFVELVPITPFQGQETPVLAKHIGLPVSKWLHSLCSHFCLLFMKVYCRYCWNYLLLMMIFFKIFGWPYLLIFEVNCCSLTTGRKPHAKKSWIVFQLLLSLLHLTAPMELHLEQHQNQQKL